jgi:hypothetical protein
MTKHISARGYGLPSPYDREIILEKPFAHDINNLMMMMMMFSYINYKRGYKKKYVSI